MKNIYSNMSAEIRSVWVHLFVCIWIAYELAKERSILLESFRYRFEGTCQIYTIWTFFG